MSNVVLSVPEAMMRQARLLADTGARPLDAVLTAALQEGLGRMLLDQQRAEAQPDDIPRAIAALRSGPHLPPIPGDEMPDD